MHVIADPQDANTVYVADVEFFKSTDGGRSFNKVKVPHGDNHGLWIDPKNTKRMIASDDGGVTVSLDGGKSWTREDNQPTAQFYHVITDTRTPYYVYGAQQDNSTVAIASRSDDGAIGRDNWYAVGGGEAGYIAPYPPDPNIVYAGDYQGNITRFDRRTNQVQNIAVSPELSDATRRGHTRAPFSVDGAHRDFSARPEHALLRRRARFQDHRRRNALGSDQRRSDAQ